MKASSSRDAPSPSKRSRADVVAQALAARIAQDELPDGARLPSENALASEFGVSRTVVREAIAMLKAEGMVATLQGSGAFVRSAGTDRAALNPAARASLSSLLDLINVRRVMESEIAARAAVARTPAQLAAIDAALLRLNQSAAEGRDGVAEDRAFHAALAEASGNRYWIHLTSALAPSIDTAIAVTRVNEAMRRDFAIEVDAEHQELRDAIAAGDPDRARAAAAHHMTRAAHRILSADQEFWDRSVSEAEERP